MCRPSLQHFLSVNCLIFPFSQGARDLVTCERPDCSDDAVTPPQLPRPQAMYTLDVVEDRESKAFGAPENELKMCHNKEHVDCRRRAIL